MPRMRDLLSLAPIILMGVFAWSPGRSEPANRRDVYLTGLLVTFAMQIWTWRVRPMSSGGKDVV